MTRLRQQRSLKAALRQSGIDTGVMLALAILVGVLNRLRSNESFIPTLPHAGLMLVVIGASWIATLVACLCGATSFSDDLSGPPSGLRSRVPDTLAIAAITGFITWIALLFLGLWE